jgi:iron complex outermembrane receptor protein
MVIMKVFQNIPYIYALICLVIMCTSLDVYAQQQDANKPEDFFDMSIEDLMEVPVTLSSKKEEKLFDTPAAVYVITSEDIRRSGAISIPEALRMVPGLQVSRINSNSWAITSRGFQDQFANKLLVLVDGRSVYSSNYSGVYWDVQDLVLEDIERIEVVRGPGGTLWGANAVNGIINIITKEAKDTQGTLLSGGVGDEERGIGIARYGGRLDENTYYRVYSKYFDRGDSLDDSGDDLGDGWDMLRGGFRIDQYKADIDHLTLQGDLYVGDVGMTGTEPSSSFTVLDSTTRVSGGNLLGRWSRIFSDTSDMEFQIYYDRFERMNSTLQQTNDTLDLDFHHHFVMSGRQQMTWGLGYRYNNNLFDSQREERRTPKRRQTNIYSAFVQDKVTLIEDGLYLTLGSKFERNSYTHWEYQPSGRLLWTPNEKNTVWAGISKAVRTPSRREIDMDFDTGIEGVFPSAVRVTIDGNRDFESEDLLSYELGYRVRPAKNFFLDVTGFYNIFDNLLTHEASASFQMVPSPHVLIEQVFNNKMDGEVYGVEVSANWNVADNWKLAGGYTFLQMQLHPDASSTSMGDFFDEALEDYSPHNQLHLRSYLDLPHDLEFDTAVYYVDSLYGMSVPSYIRCDTRLGWHISKNMELSAGVQNLFDDRHPEFRSFIVDSGEIERSFFVELTHRF